MANDGDRMNMSDQRQLQPSNIRGELRFDEPMSRHVSWGAGGNAKRFFKPADIDDLCAFMPTIPSTESILFVGLGSNLLVRDGGFDGCVVITNPMLGGIALDPSDETGRYCWCRAQHPHTSPKFAAKNHLEGAEWLAGVPGTIGGALAMNAGCYGAETWEQVVDCVTLDRGGQIHTRTSIHYEIGFIDMLRLRLCAKMSSLYQRACAFIVAMQ